MKSENNIIGVYEFARRTGRNVTALYKLIYGGKVAGVRKVYGRWLIPESCVTEWTKWAKRSPGTTRT